MKKLHPQQKKDRDLLIKAIPNEDERMAACIGLAKSASHLANFIVKASEFVEVDAETQYKVSLVLSFIMAVWHPRPDSNRSVMAKYKTDLSKQDIDERFQMCFMYLYEEAKKRKWIQ